MRLSRRRFVAFAKESEYFQTRPEVSSQCDNHPLISVDVQGDELKIELDSGLVLRGKQVLHIVIKHLRRTVALPSKSLSVNVVDATCGTIITQARLVSGIAKRELFIPLSALMPGERIFMKLASERGFYDNSGWCEIPPLQENPHTSDQPIVLSAVQTAPRVCCVLPCYNVADKCGEVLRQIAPLVHQVIAVNDGSTDGTHEVLHRIAAQSNGRIRVLSYPDNRGKGAALLNAFRMALSEIPFDLIITIDADGQHNPEDIPRLVEASVRQRAAMVIGERIQVKAMPLRSRFGNGLTRALFRWLYPFSPQDTQSGLRAMSRKLVADVIESITTQRYETELQILLFVLQSHQRLSTIAIKTIYFDKNRLSHFRPVADSLRIYWTLIKWHLPFFNPIAREGKVSK